MVYYNLVTGITRIPASAGIRVDRNAFVYWRDSGISDERLTQGMATYVPIGETCVVSQTM